MLHQFSHHGSTEWQKLYLSWHICRPVLKVLLGAQEPPIDPPDAVEIKSTLGLLRIEGVVDIVRGHPALTDRKSNCLSLCDVSYRGIIEKDGQDIESTFYGQVIAMGTAANVDFVFVRQYASPADGRGYPCTMQPLIWEQLVRVPGTYKGGILRKAETRAQHYSVDKQCSKRVKVCTVAGAFSALTLDMLLHRVCIVPDFLQGEGNFLVNDLVD